MNDNTNQLISDFFSTLLGFTPELEIEHQDESIQVQLNLPPEESGVIIGYRGEVLNSIQLVLSLMTQSHFDDWYPVRLNINDYREKRNKAIENLAETTASRVLDTNQPVRLTNLSSYERRLIHTILSENDQITTHSEGEDPNRVLIVSPTNPQ